MSEELIDKAVKLVKQREGILSNVQDEYIKTIVEGTIKELSKQNGIKVDMNDMDIFTFVIDLSSYRYSNRDSIEDMPRHLYFRLKNFYINKSNDVGE